MRKEKAVEMRRAELLRALVNLVENAARYTPRGGAVTLESHMRRAPDGAGRAVFTVQDTGPGFTPEALAKGMQPLYTGEKSRPQDGHMGLGLTFAADVARRHGGALALRNAAGGGAPPGSHHDTVVPGVFDKVPHNEEIVHVAHVVDDGQLVLQPLLQLLGDRAVPLLQPLVAEFI